MRYAGATVLFMAMFWAIAILGMESANSAWTHDCDKLGAHVVDGKVYDCAPRSDAIPDAIHRP